MALHILPTRTAGAAENMALDFLMLQRYPQPRVPRFRHYDWRGPALTFGYSQKIASVREQLSAGERLDLCRRPTGGGMVDHRDDWTYALVIPRGHPLEEVRASESYRAVHKALAAALNDQGVPAIIKPCADEPGSCGQESGEAAQNHGQKGKTATAPGLCFQRAESFDVVHEQSGEKIAGAAQKRNKHGLLFQGSISRPAAARGKGVDWERFEGNFAGRLASMLGLAACPVPWPEFNEDEVSGLTEQYSSPEWIEYR